MNKEKIIITGKMIEIKGTLARHKIVQRVVNTFIGTEYRKKGKGISFQYPVEKLSDGTLYIARPGYKKNFDFKVEIPENISLGKEKQIQIALDLRTKGYENPRKRDSLIQVIYKIYIGKQNDVDKLLKEYANLKKSFRRGIKLDDILKILKCLFIMEDIVYWDNEGRAFLYNFIYYVISEPNKKRLNEAFSKNVIKDPKRLRSYMKKAGLEWKPCKT
jgi:hypothetical protein